ncbi:hypothetical protein MRB53_017082 [Persea americana]|uniref:Uncharacterized protein n=1 Tax=Persea americana TaxID=3435 RepID=A0ACC2M404_PERAE|nr:hypothetical protein MRB53_017082 [Persea americana]
MLCNMMANSIANQLAKLTTPNSAIFYETLATAQLTIFYETPPNHIWKMCLQKTLSPSLKTSLKTIKRQLGLITNKRPPSISIMELIQ